MITLRLAKKIKNLYPNLPIHYYISPQIWAWKEKRIKIIKDCVDQMIVIFSFEKDWYTKRGVCSQFVGHPFLDIYKNIDKSAVRLKLGLSNNKRSLALVEQWGGKSNHVIIKGAGHNTISHISEYWVTIHQFLSEMAF